MKPLSSEKASKLCRRCYKNTTNDLICPACKNELIAIYENKVTWRTAYEIEKISKKAMRFTSPETEEGLY